MFIFALFNLKINIMATKKQVEEIVKNKKNLIAKEKSAKAFENLSELKIERQRFEDLAKLLNDKIMIIENKEDELGNQQAFIEHQGTQIKTSIDTIVRLNKTIEEYKDSFNFLNKLNSDLKSILKQTVDKLV